MPWFPLPEQLPQPHQAMRGCLEPTGFYQWGGPRSLGGQSGGESLQGGWELSSGQDGGGGTSLQRVMEHL